MERFFEFARTHFGAKDWAAQAQPQRLCGQARTRPTRKTLCIFEISPAEFLFSVEKKSGLSGRLP